MAIRPWLALVGVGWITASALSAEPPGAAPIPNPVSAPPAPIAPLPSPLPELLPPAGAANAASPAPAPPPAEEMTGTPTVSAEPPAPKPKDVLEWGLANDGDGYLLWWIKSTPLPPLLTRNPFGPPIPGLPGTRILVGDQPMNLNEFSGGKFSLGGGLTECPGVGIGVTYFFLGTRTSTIDTPLGGPASLGRPILDAVQDAQAAFPVRGPGLESGVARIASSARAQGIEANFEARLLNHKQGFLQGILGYRFLQLHEGLNIAQQGVVLEGVAPQPLTFALNDQFDAHNRFHGGQIGVRSGVQCGPVFLEGLAKIAFGLNTEVVKAGGMTATMTAEGQFHSQPGGLLALASNSTRLSRDVFALVPEAGLKFGLQGPEGSRLFLGYNFLYLSNAVRPGDQIDRVINLGQVPILGGPSPLTAPERPILGLKSTDVFLQGLMIGLEHRW